MLVACKANLKNIGTAYEMYASDNAGQFPTRLEALTPNYLKTIPECASAQKVTYKVSLGTKAPGNPGDMENYLYVECHGENHTKVGIAANYPAYDSVHGITTGPTSSLDPAESALKQQQEYNQVLMSQISELPSLRDKVAALSDTHLELLAAQGQKMSKEEHTQMVGKEAAKLEPVTPPQPPSDVAPPELSEPQKAEFSRLSAENKQLATQLPLLAEVQNQAKWLESDIARLQKAKPGK